MQDAIINALHTIEADYGVTILYACESGSRAYGLASSSSDYDIRFLYARPKDTYLKLDMPRDVIEEKQYNGVIVAANAESMQTLQEKGYSSVLDIVGWDIFKALRLLRTCNPHLLEWLHSSIVYSEWLAATDDPIDDLRKLADRWYGTLTVESCYFHMAEDNYNRYIRGKTPVLRKKYLYVLRPLLTLMHLRQHPQHGDIPSVNMLAMLERVSLPEPVRQHIMRLIEQKQSGDTLGLGEHDSVLNSFIEQMFVRFPRIYGSHPLPELDAELNALLAQVLASVPALSPTS